MAVGWPAKIKTLILTKALIGEKNPKPLEELPAVLSFKGFWIQYGNGDKQEDNFNNPFCAEYLFMGSCLGYQQR